MSGKGREWCASMYICCWILIKVEVKNICLIMSVYIGWKIYEREVVRLGLTLETKTCLAVAFNVKQNLK